MNILRQFWRYSYKSYCRNKRTLLLRRIKDTLKRDYYINVPSIIIEEPRFDM